MTDVFVTNGGLRSGMARVESLVVDVDGRTQANELRTKTEDPTVLSVGASIMGLWCAGADR